MAKSKGKKSRNNGPHVNPPNASKKIEKKSSKKNKKVKKINEASALDIGPSSTSTPNTTIIASSNATPPNASNKGEKKKEKGNEERVFGFIFMCNGKTKPQCYQYRVFGLPTGRKEEVAKIKVGMKLFLFDFDLKLLYGIYEASSKGQMNLEQDAFNGKFPAQVKFKIWKECLPLSEGAFKNAIRDNYEGSKFRPELTKKQVKALISLFRPINVPLPTSVAPLGSNVAPLHSFPAPLVEERFRPSAGLPPLEDPYLPGVQHTHGPLVLHPRSVQVVSSSLYDHYGATAPPSSVYDHYEAAPSVARVQASIEEPRVVRQTTFPHHTDPYYCTAAPQTYLTEKPVSSTQYPYRRYVTAPEMVPRDHPVGYEREYRVSHLPRVDEALLPIEALVDYYNQRPLPAANTHPSLRPHALGPPYVPAPASHALPELPSSHRSYYAREEPSRVYAVDPLRRPMPGRLSLAEPVAPVSSFYSFAGPPPTFR